MSGNAFQNIPTTLELNGPVLSFQTQPTDLTADNGGSVNFVGVASATVPGSQDPNYSITNTGIVQYQWYEVGVGPIVQSGIAATNTVLFLSGLSSPTDNGRRFYLEADYKPSAYSTSVYFPDVNNPVVSGDTTAPGIGTTVGRTGNAINEPLRSNIVTLTVRPIIRINIQPIEVVTSISSPATFSVDASVSDGTNSSLSYQWRRNGVNLSNSSTVSGATTNTLTISDSSSGTSQIDCVISHPSTSPANVITTPVSFSVGAPREIIKIEEFFETSTSKTATLSTKNLSEGPIRFISDPSKPYSIISLYSPEKSVKTRITLAGSAGANNSSGNLGGEGGVTTFDITLDQNTEYIVKIGSTGSPMGSAGGGGVGAFLYRKGRLIACVGGGGGAGFSYRGGAGGGINVSGENGFGRGAGTGAASVSAGTLTAGLTAISGSTGGKAAPCPPGGYYSTLGFSACEDVGTAVRFLNQDGVVVTNTALIKRGYKVGNAGILNGGIGNSTLGGGGGGVRGGNAAVSDFSGGGGGSGYTDGSVTVVTTGSGGNTSTNGYINIELSPTTISGYTGPGIYLDLTGESGTVPLNISTSEESGIFHYINIPGIDNIPENLGFRTYNVAGGRVYGPCTAPNGGLYIGNETPVGGISTLVVEEGGDDWNDMILYVNRGYFRRLTGPVIASTPSVSVPSTSTSGSVTSVSTEVTPVSAGDPPTIVVVHTQSGRTGYKQETFETVLRSYDKNKSTDGEAYGTNRKAFNGITFGPGQWSIKAKYRDIEIVATVAGAAGQNASNGTGTALGGLGGIGNVAFRMPRDVEFTFQVGETGIDEAYPDENAPSGGQRGPDMPSGMGQGGGCSIIYKGGEVLAVSGGGGGAGRGGQFVGGSETPPNAGGNGGGAHKDGRSGGEGVGGNGGAGATKDAPGRNKNASYYPVDNWQRNGECSLYAPGEQDGLCPCTYNDALSPSIGGITSSQKSCDKYGIARI
jgi:hypothetical protein